MKLLDRWRYHWIGKNNFVGHVRYWYYSKRGWIVNGQSYYVKSLTRSKWAKIKEIYRELTK